MARNERNPELIYELVDLQVFISTEDDPKIGRGGKFGHEWYTAGILPEEAKFDLDRAIEKNKVKGFAFGVVKTTAKPGDVTSKVPLLEDNEVTEMAAWADTAVDEGVKLLRHTGKMLKAHVAIVEYLDNGDIRIRATRAKATLTIEALGRGKDPEGRELQIDYQNDKDQVMFEQWIIKSDGTEADMNLKQIRFVEDSEIKMNDAHEFKFNISSATGGTFDIASGPFKAEGMKHNASANDIKEALKKAGDTDIDVTGNASSGYVVKNSNGDVTVDGSKLEGGTYKTKGVPVEVADAAG